MKRLIQIILCITFLIPTAAIVSADDKVQGGMTIHTTKIVKEKKEKKEKRVKPPKEKKPLEPITPGWQHNISFGAVTDCDQFVQLPNFNYIFGYRFNNLLYLGIGTGFNYTIDDSYYNFYSDRSSLVNGEECNLGIRSAFIPLFLHARAYFTRSRWQPFVALSTGTNIALESGFFKVKQNDVYRKYNGTNLFIEPMIGISCRTSSKFSINLQVGLNVQGTHKVKLIDSRHLGVYQAAKSSLSVKLGCTF